MASAYLFAMLAVTPSESREVALIANPEFEAGRVAGHRARRLIDGGNPAFSDPFLVMAEDWVPRDAFSRHPHRGIETVTLVLDGALEHFDNAGNTGVINTGDAQWMTAGRGVIHNENPLSGTTAHALQLWVNLPASEKMAAPRYQDVRGADLPTRREPGVEIRLLPGSSGGVSSPTLNHVPVTAIDARMDDGADHHYAGILLGLRHECVAKFADCRDQLIGYLLYRCDVHDGRECVIRGLAGPARSTLAHGNNTNLCQTPLSLLRAF
jgi:hypothetical protein